MFINGILKLDLTRWDRCLFAGAYVVEGGPVEEIPDRSYAYPHIEKYLDIDYEYIMGLSFNSNFEDFSSKNYYQGQEDRKTVLTLLNKRGIIQ